MTKQQPLPPKLSFKGAARLTRFLGAGLFKIDLAYLSVNYSYFKELLFHEAQPCRTNDSHRYCDDLTEESPAFHHSITRTTINRKKGTRKKLRKFLPLPIDHVSGFISDTRISRDTVRLRGLDKATQIGGTQFGEGKILRDRVIFLLIWFLIQECSSFRDILAGKLSLNDRI